MNGTDSIPSPSPPRAVPELSIVVPVLDEEETLEAVFAELEEKLAGRGAYEVLFIDDGSRDGTAALVAELCARHRHVRLVRHAATCGKSAGLITGARFARAPWIASMDGDGQNDPDDLWRLWQAACGPEAPAGLTLVAGNRRRRNDTLLKRLSSRIANRVRRALTGDPTPDAACGVKVYRRSDFLALPRFDNMHRFLSALFLRQGGAVVSVPVEDRPRAGGRSKYGFHNRLWVGIGDLLGVMWLQRRALPPNRAEEVGARPAQEEEGR